MKKCLTAHTSRRRLLKFVSCCMCKSGRGLLYRTSSVRLVSAHSFV
jgi:hypothetical protein